MTASSDFKLSIKDFAQIRDVEIDFGDLTVLVGPQGTGKSLALQWLKLGVDERQIAAALRDAGFDLKTPEEAADAYFGEGMRGALKKGTRVTVNGNQIKLKSLTRKFSKSQEPSSPSMFLIPAHRALLLSEGWPAPFMKLGADTPVVARLFSQALYEQLSRPSAGTVFPQSRVLIEDIRRRIDESVFHGGKVSLQSQGLRRRLELKFGDSGLPFMTWTAGQREFAPLLLGLYSVLPQRQKRKIEGLDWVVIEEPEMGLHPRAVATVMVLVIDLLWRGYRVVLSTHSPLVLDVVWALRSFSKPGAPISELAKALQLSSAGARDKLKAAITKDLRVYYLAHGEDNLVASHDISGLDIGAEAENERNWGGLTFFANSLSTAVSRIPGDDE